MNTSSIFWSLLLLLVSSTLLALPFWPAWTEWRRPRDRQAWPEDTPARTPPVSAATSLHIAPGATFGTLHSAHLLLGCGPMPAALPLPGLQRWQPPPGARPWGVHGWHIGHHLVIGADQLVPCTLVVRGRLSIQGPGQIEGDLKARDELHLGAGTRVLGNLFSEGDIWLGPGCSVSGLVMAEGRLHLAPGVEIGTTHKPVSVCADLIEVHGPVLVHGSVQARLGGSVACVDVPASALPARFPSLS